VNVGLDIGYTTVKVVGKEQVCFPSAVGSVDHARFNWDGEEGIVLSAPRAVMVGDLAIEQSRALQRREDRNWIASTVYANLLLAGLTETTKATHVRLNIVSGLPVQFYKEDKAALVDLLMGNHKATREGRSGQSFTVENVRVIEQGFGALLAECLDARGNIVDADLATGRIGVIDVGGKTTNLLSVKGLREIGRQTSSVSTGAWDIVRAVREWLSTECPELDLRDYEIVDCVKTRSVRYFGEPVDLSSVVDDLIGEFSDSIVAEVTQLWNGAAQLDAILVAGGGAHLVGEAIKARYRHARTVSVDPVFANAIGYKRFCERLYG
jgi:plasmid segregation protein ParM